MSVSTQDFPKGRGPGRPSAPWNPSIRDLEVYAGVCRGRTTREVGREYGITGVRVTQISNRIDDWLFPQWMDYIRRIKARQTNCLIIIFREAMDAWERSKHDYESIMVKSGEKGKETSATKRKQAGAAAFLSEARAALADIRKIWGADAPLEFVDATDHDRIAGRPREEVIREHIGLLTAALEPSDN